MQRNTYTVYISSVKQQKTKSSLLTGCAIHLRPKVPKFSALNDKKAHPFLIGAFYDLGSARQVRAAFAVCVKTGELKRLARGVYARPKQLRFSNRPYFGSAEDLAQLWAKQCGYAGRDRERFITKIKS